MRPPRLIPKVTPSEVSLDTTPTSSTNNVLMFLLRMKMGEKPISFNVTLDPLSLLYGTIKLLEKTTSLLTARVIFNFSKLTHKFGVHIFPLITQWSKPSHLNRIKISFTTLVNWYPPTSFLNLHHQIRNLTLTQVCYIKRLKF